MDKLTLPTRTANRFVEHRGTYDEVQVEDRPFRVLENQFIEHKGVYEDVEQPLTDMEILLVGGVDVFFDANGKRKAGNWPWTGEDKAKKVVKKKKRAKKKK